MTTIRDKLQAVHARIDAACAAAGRAPGSVRLLAVSKTFGADVVRAAYAAGQRDFGENYVQEGVAKIAALADLPGLRWHCIGPLQSNKTREVAEHFDAVQSVDRPKIAERLAAQRPPGRGALDVWLQVNIDGGANKAGVAPADALVLARAVLALPALRLRGLMVIPEPAPDFIAAKAVHTLATGLFDHISADLGPQAPAFDTLSAGMSADLEAAVAAGSGMVRIGSALFGAR